VSGKKSLQYSMHNFNNVFLWLLAWRLHFTKILENFAHVLAYHWRICDVTQKCRIHHIPVNNILCNNYDKFKCIIVIFGKQNWKNDVHLFIH